MFLSWRRTTRFVLSSDPITWPWPRPVLNVHAQEMTVNFGGSQPALLNRQLQESQGAKVLEVMLRTDYCISFVGESGTAPRQHAQTEPG